MNTTITRVAKYTGAGIACIATSCVLAAPALAMQPPYPDPRTVSPGNEQMADHLQGDPGSSGAEVSPGNARIADHWDGHTGSPVTATGTSSTSDGVDWSSLGTGLAGGVLLTGAIAGGATQLRRRQMRPA